MTKLSQGERMKEDKSLRLALSLVSGRKHPANMGYGELLLLGFSENEIEEGFPESSILEAAEDMIYYFLVNQDLVRVGSSRK